MTNKEALLGIRSASLFLGVSEAALRLWTDEHKIKAFITPGGHRRYSINDLKSFMSTHQKLFGVKDLVSQLEESASLHKNLDTSFLEAAPRYQIETQTKSQFAILGRQILMLIARCVSEPTHQEELLSSIKEIGTALGKMTAEFGMSITDSVQIFIQHREPLMRGATEMMKRGEGVQRRVVDAIPLVDHAMDEALVALVAAYQKYRKTEVKTTDSTVNKNR